MKHTIAVILLTLTCTLSLAAGHISGTQGACIGSFSHYTDSLEPGGTWSSSDVNIATVDASGYVTAVAPGVATITYAHGASYITAPFTTSPIPEPITGQYTICSRSTTLLSDPTPGGSWTASGAATVNSHGLVTGDTSGGRAVIYYTTGTGCFTSFQMSIDKETVAPITGPKPGYQVVYAMMTLPFSDETPNGVWSSSNISIAKISPEGVILGVSTGMANIYYTVTFSCGPVSVAHQIQVQ